MLDILRVVKRYADDYEVRLEGVCLGTLCPIGIEYLMYY